ncbi:hypothetical protein TESG_00546 [Trichophyton tonsurans CBS 112818]|uniref:DNA/RNA-binding domain-containing protein n=1 Tax=Trichophyton tonsurans (strain CBS 112818) TaxID=647933 RepID=F2RNS8_TRIT1|nr:hypothetical protein TESG_00546 [Trichophyton tonsurans CBS 112818]
MVDYLVLRGRRIPRSSKKRGLSQSKNYSSRSSSITRKTSKEGEEGGEPALQLNHYGPSITLQPIQCCSHPHLHSTSLVYSHCSDSELLTIKREEVYFSARLHTVPAASTCPTCLDGQAKPALIDPAADIGVKDDDEEGRRLECTTYLLLQPETRQITEDQLTVEVKGIYDSLFEAEKKCIEVDTQQLDCGSELTPEQYKALIAIHQTLMHEYYDFFLASGYPSAPECLRKLAREYTIPQRIWRHAIYPMLDLLHRRLPSSHDYMVSYIYTTYTMLTLLLESVPTFKEVWMEYLGDVARYRMAIEETDCQERKNWENEALCWYQRAADEGPNIGRIQHHSAVLAKPYTLRLFYYTKSLVCVEPFATSRENILFLFNPLLEESQPQQHRVALKSYVKAHGIMFKRLSVLSFFRHVLDFFCALPQHISYKGQEFREQGIYISSSNIATLFINDDKDILKGYSKALKLPWDSRASYAREHWLNCSDTLPSQTISLDSYIPTTYSTQFTPSTTSTSTDTALAPDPISPFQHTAHLAMHTFCLLLRKIGDKNVLPAVHVSLAFLYTLALTPKAMDIFEPLIPFNDLATFLNALKHQSVGASILASDSFPAPKCSESGYLPEDFAMRGQDWARLYFPDNHFKANSTPVGGDKTKDTLGNNLVRVERCLWIGCRLASMKRWITYDANGRFNTTNWASRLERASQRSAFFLRAAEVLTLTNAAETFSSSPQ